MTVLLELATSLLRVKELWTKQRAPKLGPKNILTRFIKIVVSFSVSLSCLPLSNHILSINPKPSPPPKQTPKPSLQATQRQLLAESNILFSLSFSSCLLHLLVFFYAYGCVMSCVLLLYLDIKCKNLYGFGSRCLF